MSAKIEATEALAHFVRVFNDLDWKRFRSCFSEDVTVFSPFPYLDRRTAGLEELEHGWRSVFVNGPKNLPGPPYLNIAPTDVCMQPIGNAAFLVTFHLENLMGATCVNRRTLVMEKREERWFITHLHASQVADAS